MGWFSESLDNKSIDELVELVGGLSAVGYTIDNKQEIDDDMQRPLAARLQLVDFEKLDMRLAEESGGRANLARGGLWQTYVFWHLKGDARNCYLERAVKCYETSVIQTTLEEQNGIDARLALARILIDYPATRDLPRGLSLMEEVYGASSDYVPAYSTYLQALNLDKQYRKVVEVANDMIAHSSARVAPAVHKIKAKALRAIVRESKKNGDIQESLLASVELMNSQYSTANDRKTYEKIVSLCDN
ncbi:hypothetical protein [Halomonas sp.]|uniref:hypothetical protein n=1 Tax=Halomonas sp. TaxID=1486246 RepID=UPI00384CAD82